MILKVTLQKESPKQSLPKVPSEAAVRRCFFVIVAGLRACNYLKETSTQVFSCEYCEIFTKSFFIENLNKGWFLLKRFVDLVIVRYLHIISRNHSNILLLRKQNLSKVNHCSKSYLF